MMIELVFNNIPVRFFHFLYTSFVVLLYILGNFLGFLSNPERNGTYSAFIDWTDNDAGFFLGTVGTLMLFGLVGSTIIHIIAWCVYQLKHLLKQKMLSGKCMGNSVRDHTIGGMKNVSMTDDF